MPKMISLHYYWNAEEVRPRFLKAYHDADDVIKLDSLLDAMYCLELEYEKVHARCYPRLKLLKKEKHNGTTD